MNTSVRSPLGDPFSTPRFPRTARPAAFETPRGPRHAHGKQRERNDSDADVSETEVCSILCSQTSPLILSQVGDTEEASDPFEEQDMVVDPVACPVSIIIKRPLTCSLV